MDDRVSRYWQVFKLRHQQSVLTAAALHLLDTHTHTRQKLQFLLFWLSLKISLQQVNMLAGEGRGIMVAGELIRVGCEALPGHMGRLSDVAD